MSATNNVDQSQTDNIIQQVTDLNQSENEIKRSAGDAEDKIKASGQQNSDNNTQTMVILIFFNSQFSNQNNLCMHKFLNDYL